MALGNPAPETVKIRKPPCFWHEMADCPKGGYLLNSIGWKNILNSGWSCYWTGSFLLIWGISKSGKNCLCCLKKTQTHNILTTGIRHILQTTIKTTTGLQPLKDSSHGVSPLRKAWSWEALPCWACRQASSSPWGASSGGNSWCLSLWWDCHHVISRFSMGHHGTFSTCILGSTLVIKPSSHTENDFGLWFLLIFLAALRCQHCRHKYRCSESAAQEKILWLSTNPNQFIVTLGIWRTLM